MRQFLVHVQVLDDFTFDFDDVSSEEEKDLFREFLYKSSIEPVWRAFYHGMNIVRAYEDEAFNIIIETLNRDTIFKKTNYFIWAIQVRENRLQWQVQLIE